MLNSDVLRAFTKTLVDFWAKIAHFRGIEAFYTGLQARYKKNVITLTPAKI
jgi:hypothetical protein